MYISTGRGPRSKSHADSGTPDWDSYAQDLPKLDRRVASKTLTLPAPTLVQELEQTVSSSMTCGDIIDLLTRHGSKNLTALFVPEYCSRYPVSTGGFGDVYRSHLLDDRKVAVKIVRVFENGEPGKYQKWTARELYAWSKCRHPNIVELMGLVMFKDSLAMVSQWAENGTLPTYLKKHPSVDRCRLSGLICDGLAYLHSKDIIHGDLKGENVLIASSGTPKLNDFGSASVHNASLHFSESTTGVKFSTRWAAPELLEEETTVHTFKTDIYALGMTILETFTGNVPYPNKRDIAVIRWVTSGKLPPRPNDVLPANSIAGDELWDLLVSCWSYQPLERPSAAAVRLPMKSIKYHLLLPPLPPVDDEEESAVAH